MRKHLRAVSFDPAADFQAAFRSFIFSCEGKNRAPRTVEWYGQMLRPFLAFLAEEGLRPADVTRHHLREWLAALPDTFSVPTRNGYLRAARAFFSHLHREGYLEGNPAQGVPMQREFQRIFPTF